MHRGYIKIWRKVKDSGLYQLPNAFTLFVYMLTEAAYRPIKFGTVDINRGELCTGRHKLSSELGMSEQTIRTALDHLHNLGMITSKPTNKYTVYTIVNYGQYQDCDTPNNQQVNQQSTNEQPTNNQPTTTNKELKHLSIKEKPISSPKGSRYPEDSFLTATWGNIALELRKDWTNDDVRIEYDAFKDFWIAKPGKDGVKLDWLATWRNWCRNSKRKGQENAV